MSVRWSMCGDSRWCLVACDGERGLWGRDAGSSARREGNEREPLNLGSGGR